MTFWLLWISILIYPLYRGEMALVGVFSFSRKIYNFPICAKQVTLLKVFCYPSMTHPISIWCSWRRQLSCAGGSILRCWVYEQCLWGPFNCSPGDLYFLHLFTLDFSLPVVTYEESIQLVIYGDSVKGFICFLGWSSSGFCTCWWSQKTNLIGTLIRKVGHGSLWEHFISILEWT